VVGMFYSHCLEIATYNTNNGSLSYLLEIRDEFIYGVAKFGNEEM